MTRSRPLDAELEALREVMFRLMNEETSLDTLCKHLPRLTSVSANVARIQNALEANDNEATDMLLKALADLANEEADGDFRGDLG